MIHIEFYILLYLQLQTLPRQGITRRLKKASKEIDQFLEQIIQDHEHNQYDNYKVQKAPHNNKDFVDILLSLMNQPINRGPSEQPI